MVLCPEKQCRKPLEIARLLHGYTPRPGVTADGALSSFRTILAHEFYRHRQFQLLESHETPPRCTLIPQRASVTEHTYRLTLWCDYPGRPHPCSPIWSDGPGDFEIVCPKDVLEAARRTISWTLGLLGPIAAAGTLAVEMWSKDGASIEEALTWLSSCVKTSDTDPERHSDAPLPIGLQRIAAEGDEARRFREFLREHVKGKGWGNLRRFSPRPEEVLWLCPEHYAELQQTPPPMPSGYLEGGCS